MELIDQIQNEKCKTPPNKICREAKKLTKSSNLSFQKYQTKNISFSAYSTDFGLLIQFFIFSQQFHMLAFDSFAWHCGNTWSKNVRQF